jgi:hypothetical protein
MSMQPVLRVAWWAVLLGLTMEALVMLAGAGFGASLVPPTFAADTMQKVSWSFIVCVGLALGAVASRSPVTTLPFAGLIAAPLGFAAARAVHKGMSEAVSAGGGGVPAPVVTLAVLKAVEYGVLGFALASLARRRDLGARPHALIGLAVGVVFGGAALAIQPRAALATQVARAVNEVLFPVGCSLVLYAAHALRRRLPAPT